MDSSLAKSLEGLVTAEMAGKLGKVLGVEVGLVERGVKILAGLAVGSLGRKVATHEGAVVALASLPEEEEPGVVEAVFSALWGEAPEETAADQLRALYGGGVNSMLAALGQRLGFDVARLAGILAPLMGQHLAKVAREEGLDASGFARRVRDSEEAFFLSRERAVSGAGAGVDLKASEGDGAVGIVREMLAIGDEAVALRGRFTEAELEAVHLAPLAAYWLVAEASLSGIRGTIREMKAAGEASVEVMKTMPPVSLLGVVFGGGGLSSAEEEELMRDTRSEEDLLGNIRAGAAVVREKAAGEWEGFCTLVREVGKRTAEASKEGGFLGIGRVRVSEKEREALGRIEGALGE